MNDVPYCSAWRDQSTVPTQTGTGPGMGHGQLSKGTMPDRNIHGASGWGSWNTISISPQSGCSQLCLPHCCSNFFHMEHHQLSLRTWICLLQVVPGTKTLQCWVAVCCPAARSTHLPLSGGLTHLWTNCFLILGDDPEFLRAKTTPKQKRQCDFRVDAHPRHCFSMLAPQGPQFTSCTLTLAPLVIVLSHTQVRTRMMFQFTTLPFLVILQRNQCSDTSDFYWVVGLYFMLWRNTYFT